MFKRILFNKNFQKKFMLSASALAGFHLISQQRQRKAQCCGIIGILSTTPNPEKIILDGIHLLQNRGYDSAGVATFNKEGEMTLTKFATDYKEDIDCIEKLKIEVPKRHKDVISGIGHTRWATCGPKTDYNAHPHTDQKNRIALIHNGTLDNVQGLRKELLDQGVQLSSETDTELIAQFIGLNLDKGMSLLEAVQQTLSEKIQGTWGILCIEKSNPTQMVVARYGSPLLVGLAPDAIYVASERIAFEKYTKNFLALNDGEIFLLDISQRDDFFEVMKHRVTIIKEKQNIQMAPREPYKTFFDQEINEQPEAVLKCMNNGARLSFQLADCTKLGGLEQHIEEIKALDNVAIVACGSSFYAGLYGAKLFKRLHCFDTLSVIEASEFTSDDLPRKNAGALFISQSGETADIYKALQVSKELELFTIGCVNVVGSLIASNVNTGVYLNSGREVAVPATKSFTSQIVALTLISIWVSYHKNPHNSLLRQARIELKNVLRQLPVAISEVIKGVEKGCQAAALVLKDCTSLMVLGKGFAGPIAKEGALKIKECTYMHAEAFYAGEMKHGPIAMLESEKVGESKVILIILDDEYFHDMELALSEVKSRNAYTIVITDCRKKLTMSKVDICIDIFSMKELTALMAVIPMQRISALICTHNKINPDKPRNLAKTVTVG